MAKITIGIDLGSRTSKIVILKDNEILYSKICGTGVNPKITAQHLYQEALEACNLSESDIYKIYSTGYGRNIVPFSDKKIAEISCHARGVNYFFPEARTIIDIGGQDSKAILINSKGKVTDFLMNDKCAAGTGRFLEVAATILELTVDDLGELSLKSTEHLEINSTCVVFAESEIVGLISQEKKMEDIIAAIHHSIAKRTRNLIAQLHWTKPIVFTGGVAKNIGMRKALSDLLDTEILVPENSFITGALGAAIFAAEAI